MKKQILFLVVVSSIISVNAQVSKYYPFPDSNAYWGNENNSFNGTTNVTTDYGTLLKGDTVIGGKTYHKLYNLGDISTAGSTNYYVYNGAFRDDTAMHKVYTVVRGVDSLLYDFNQKAGDSIGYPQGPASGMDYVYSVDSIMIFGNYRKRINITNTKTNPPHQILNSIIEGIGSNKGAFNIECLPPPFENGTQVLCFRQNNDTVQFNHGFFYQNCHEFEAPLGINTVNSAVQFTVYPNPANNEVAITCLIQGKSYGTLQLYNALGQLVSSSTISGMGQVNENISGLSNGIYYYTLSVNGVIAATSKLVVIH